MDHVLITHPGLPTAKPASTSQEAFDLVWKDKGWKITSPADALKLELAAAAPAEPAKPAKTVGGAA